MIHKIKKKRRKKFKKKHRNQIISMLKHDKTELEKEKEKYINEINEIIENKKIINETIEKLKLDIIIISEKEDLWIIMIKT